MRHPTVLKTNKHFFPIAVQSWKEVMCDLFSGDTKAVDTQTYQMYSFDEWLEYDGCSYNGHIDTVHGPIKIPLVVAEQRYDRIPLNRVMFPSNRNIWNRDGKTCQYTGLKLHGKHLSIDHVHPVSKGGRTSWDNLVTCHREFNSWKSSQDWKELNLADVAQFQDEDLEKWRQRELQKGNTRVFLKTKPEKPEHIMGIVFDEMEEEWAGFVQGMS